MNIIASIIGSGLAVSAGGLWLANRKKSERQSYRVVFSTLSSPIMPQAMVIKRNYGFLERDLYVIKSHRTKESLKVQDTCQLADQIVKVIEENQQLVSAQVLERYYEVKGSELGLAELQQDPNSQGNSYIGNATLYKLKKSKLLLTLAFMEDLKKTAKKAELFSGNLKDLLEFYPVFLSHLIENELILVDGGPAVLRRAIHRL
ncbi:MAG: hypothetical protein ACI4XL_13475 [Bacillus sp. (in: firmicutes)]